MVDLILTMFSSLLNLYLLFVGLFFRVIFNTLGKSELFKSFRNFPHQNVSHLKASFDGGVAAAITDDGKMGIVAGPSNLALINL